LISFLWDEVAPNAIIIIIACISTVYEMMQEGDANEFIALEVKVLRTHIHENIRMAGLWHPLIMSFQELYGLAPKRAIHRDLQKSMKKGTGHLKFCGGYRN
jgi:hypothetical protein